MNKPFRYATLIAAALLLPMAAAAHDRGHDRDDDEDRRPINEHRPLKADADVSVSNVAGLIDVEAWDKNEVFITGELAEEVESLEITGGPSDLHIDVKLPKRVRDVGDTQLKLRLPAGVHLDADSVSADIGVRGLSGPVSLKTVSGDLRVKGTSNKVEMQSVSGNIDLDAPATNTQLETVSGDITLRGGRGELHAQSVSGDVHVEARELRKCSIDTVSGDLELAVELTKDAELNVESLSGQVELTMPSLPEVELEMETFSGVLESAFTGGHIHDKDYHREGSGKGHVRLHSFSGDILLKKR